MELPLLFFLISTTIILSLTLSVLFYLRRCRRRVLIDLEQPSTLITKPSTTPREHTWQEIITLTSSFSPSSIIGHGGFSTVYLSSTPSAVKVHRSSERLHRAFRNELSALQCLHHPNIVSLLGFSDPSAEDGALILQYIPNNTLYHHLHVTASLSWASRTAIAVQLASALEYLHDTCNPQVVHGDMKAANVLLDETLNVKICDFGSAQIGLGFSASVSAAAIADRKTMMGSPGYVDPYYIRTGMVSKKSDVYSYGVLLLEIVSGEEAFGDKPLAARAGEVVVDERLNGEYDGDEAETMVALARRCVGDQPSLRPAMAEVVGILREKMKRGEREGW